MDWTGSARSIYTTLGASNHTDRERIENDYYATDPNAINYLLDNGEQFSKNILEPAAGEGHLSERLKQFGYNVTSYDLINRGYCRIKDFFDITEWDGDIITNPPYKEAQSFVEHAIDIIHNGNKVAMFLKLTFLEGQKRAKLFRECPPKTVYVSRKRIKCAANGNFEAIKSSAVAYAWFVWEKGFKGKPTIEWIN